MGPLMCCGELGRLFSIYYILIFLNCFDIFEISISKVPTSDSDASTDEIFSMAFRGRYRFQQGASKKFCFLANARPDRVGSTWPFLTASEGTTVDNLVPHRLRLGTT
jgi:hypothetical protein